VGKLNESDEAGNQSEEVTNKSNESKHTYKDLNDIIGNYEGSMTCSKKECADALSEYLEKNGWDTSVEEKTFVDYGTRWCVVIDTDDEGQAYAVMEN